MISKVFQKVVLVILDGLGVAAPGRGNALTKAAIPTLNYLVANFPSTTLQASGSLVGLPWGEMGNSEVGHLNIGAGRIVGQDLPRITASIQNGEFFKNPVFLGAMEHAKNHQSALHLMGMVSGGGVHSFDEHLYALLAMASEQRVKNVFIHMFTDGRDTDEKVALESLKKLNEKISQTGVGKVATLAGRFYAMDRGGHWGQTLLAYDALVNGQGDVYVSPEDCVRQNYQSQIFDEMIKPSVIVETQPDAEVKYKPVGQISDNDAVIFFNFRSDRTIQLAKMFLRPDLVPVEFREEPPHNLYFATMTDYLKDLNAHVAFAPVDFKNNLAEVLSQNNFSQFHIAESEKYAHVTAFFNCGRSEKFPGEERLIVTSPSDNIRNYVDKPEMSAGELTRELVERITKSDIRFFVANFANPDMVGHTGNIPAAEKAIEEVDRCLKKILDACIASGAVLMVTADHGNVETMINSRTGDINKDHTTSPVPFLLMADEFKFKAPLDKKYLNLAAVVPGGAISDIAPTILNLFGLKVPKEMTGGDLINIIFNEPGKITFHTPASG